MEVIVDDTCNIDLAIVKFTSVSSLPYVPKDYRANLIEEFHSIKFYIMQPSARKPRMTTENLI